MRSLIEHVGMVSIKIALVMGDRAVRFFLLNKRNGVMLEQICYQCLSAFKGNWENIPFG